MPRQFDGSLPGSAAFEVYTGRLDFGSHIAAFQQAPPPWKRMISFCAVPGFTLKLYGEPSAQTVLPPGSIVVQLCNARSSRDGMFLASAAVVARTIATIMVMERSMFPLRSPLRAALRALKDAALGRSTRR